MLIASFSFAGCPVEIGKIYPESQYIHAMSQVSVHLSDSLKSTPVDEILCVLDSLVTGVSIVLYVTGLRTRVRQPVDEILCELDSLMTGVSIVLYVTGLRTRVRQPVDEILCELDSLVTGVSIVFYVTGLRTRVRQPEVDTCR